MPSSDWSPATSEAPKKRCPSLKRKRVTPHVLRHTAACNCFDTASIARSSRCGWGTSQRRTTQIYLHADLRRRKRPSQGDAVDMPPGRFRPDDELLASWRVSDYAGVSL